jgi:hypothetical protein
MNDMVTLGIVFSEVFVFAIGLILVTCLIGYAFTLRLKKSEGKKEV